MVFWFWVGLAVVAVPPIAYGLVMAALFLYVRWKYLGFVVRIFQERPLFVIPRGTADDDAEDVRVPAADGLGLRGCYLRTPAPARKGVVLFGLEFGSNRWACRHYCVRLLAAGYDVFTYEPRNQGDSDKDANYEPLQWVTDRDLSDMRAAVRYLAARPDADHRGVGVFGVSKGGSTGLLAAMYEPAVRCVATDGAYATYTTMVPYMRKWIGLYSNKYRIQRALPTWFLGLIGVSGVRKVAKNRGVVYPSVEKAVRKMRRPLLMIHGEADSYIRPEMAQSLYSQATGPKDLWIVPKARHNQALAVAGDEYHARIVAFFDAHLGAADGGPADAPAAADARAKGTPGPRQVG